MKKSTQLYLLSLLLLFCFFTSYAQIGINTDGSSADVSAILNVKSSDMDSSAIPVIAVYKLDNMALKAKVKALMGKATVVNPRTLGPDFGKLKLGEMRNLARIRANEALSFTVINLAVKKGTPIKPDFSGLKTGSARTDYQFVVGGKCVPPSCPKNATGKPVPWTTIPVMLVGQTAEIQRLVADPGKLDQLSLVAGNVASRGFGFVEIRRSGR